jgi:prepilin-type N-terminal cleavage/methylation domain-containing protein
MSRIRTQLGNGGFTLIELVIIIVVLGIIAAIAVPKYQNIATEAKESSCKGALGGLRSGINIWYANEAAKGNTPTYPPIDSLRTVGVVMEQALPTNPYQPDAGDSIVTGVTKGTIVGTRGGWAYRASTGEIWPNTNTVGENAW